MAERAAVNREVAGSSPARAAIYCRMDDWQVALTLNQREVGSTPTPASISMPCGVTGNIPLFESEDSRFKPWRGSWEVNSRLGHSPVFLPSLTPVAQLEEAIALEAMRCRFKSCQEYQTSGCNSVVRSLGLGPRSRGFKSYHPDHLPL